MSEQHQLRISVNDAYLERVRKAETAGRVTNVSGLGKLALWHAMENGQVATEALLRTGGSVDQDQGAEQLVGQIMVELEQLVAGAAEDVKRWVLQFTAVIVGLLVLLAVGTAVYLRPSTGTA